MNDQRVVLILHDVARPCDTQVKVKSMTEALPHRVCPFCGLPSAIPHETQAVCVEALQREIDRMRDILNHVKDPLTRVSPDEDVELT
jgi:predicted nucleic acid-binding Zn ribbon protein